MFENVQTFDFTIGDNIWLFEKDKKLLKLIISQHLNPVDPSIYPKINLNLRVRIN